MKKAVLATAVLTALVSGSTFAATVYDNDGTKIKVGGRAVGMMEFSDENKSTTENTYKDESYARLSLSGKSQLDETTYGFGKFEVEANNNDTVSLKNRYQYAGLGFDGFGALSYGRQDSAQQLVADFTDVFNEFSGKAADIISANKSKQEQNLVYTGEFDAVTLQANYILSSDKDDDSYGLAAIYSISDSLKVGAGYTDQDGDKTSNQMNIGAEYKANNLKLAALIASGKKNDDKANVTEIIAQYKLGKTTLGAGYEKLDYDSAANSSSDVDFVVAELQYKFNGYSRVFADYKFNQVTDGEDAIRLGLRFDF